MLNAYLRVACLLIALFQVFVAESQPLRYQTTDLVVPPAATVNIQNLQEDFNPTLQHLEMPNPSGNGIWMQLRRKKQELPRLFSRRFGKNDTVVPVGDGKDPSVGVNFDGNKYNSRVPNDNDLAISDSGFVVSVTNSIIYMYDASQNQFLKSISLNAFTDTLGITEGKYDPKTLYDPEADRFIVVCLSGNLDSTSSIILAFSETNDPTGHWNLYALNGDPVNNGTWSDFPSIALSKDELFLTVNTFENGSTNNSGFTESTFWQIDKATGYSGQPLITRYFSGLTFGNEPFFNITPMQGGDGLYGPKMYMLSNHNLSTHSDTLFLLEMDNTIANNGQLVVTFLRAPLFYWLPPPARQGNGNWFDTNDSRILGGFLEDNTIQFVANTGVPTTGLAGIYHGFIDEVSTNPTVSVNIIGDTSLDFGYPNIAYTGINAGDQDAVITFNHVSPSVNSGFSGIYFDENEDYSDIVRLKEGFSYVDVLQDTLERWGDYSGIQRKYNEPGKVWAVGSYGRGNVNRSWIAELGRPYMPGKNDDPEPVYQAKTFPNPFAQTFTVNFELERATRYRMALYDQQGRLVKILLTGQAKPGANTFSFSPDPLHPGIYILRFETEDPTQAFSRKVIKQ